MPIRIAVQEPSDQLNVQPADRKRWIILLTDGKQHTDDCLTGSVREPEYNDPEVVNFRNDFLASRQINFLAAGLGAGNAISGSLLRTLAGGPDDYFDFASEGQVASASGSMPPCHEYWTKPRCSIRMGSSARGKS